MSAAEAPFRHGLIFMRILIIFLYQIGSIISQDFQFATYTSTQVAPEPSSGLSQNNPAIENGDNNLATPDIPNGGAALDGVNSVEAAQNTSNVGGVTLGTAEATCTPGVLIGTFNLVGKY